MICKSDVLDVCCLAPQPFHIVFCFELLSPGSWNVWTASNILLIFGFWLVQASGITGRRNMSQKDPLYGVYVCLSESHRTFKEPMSQGLVITPSSCQFRWKSSKNALLLLASRYSIYPAYSIVKHFLIKLSSKYSN